MAGSGAGAGAGAGADTGTGSQTANFSLAVPHKQEWNRAASESRRSTSQGTTQSTQPTSYEPPPLGVKDKKLEALLQKVTIVAAMLLQY